MRELNTGELLGGGQGRLAGDLPDKNVWLAVFESMFLHGSILHLAGNMLFLWIFGNNVEDHFGHVGFTLFYFVAGVAAMGAHYLADSGLDAAGHRRVGRDRRRDGRVPRALARARVLTVIALLFFVPVYLPAAVAARDLVRDRSSSPRNPNAGVAWLAHVGGFVAGALIALAPAAAAGPPRRRVQPAEPPQWGWGR